MYPKAAHTDLVLNLHSHHSRSTRAAVVHTLLSRIETHFSEDDKEVKDLERQHVFGTLIANDYPCCFVERIANRRSQPWDWSDGRCKRGGVLQCSYRTREA